MSNLGKKITKAVGKFINKISNSLSQDENTVHQAESYETEGFGSLIREVGGECIVLLRNDGVLPLDKEEEVAVFGRCQYDWFYIGYGSGGDVIAPYKINLVDGLRNAGVKVNEALMDAYIAWATTPENVPDHGFWGHWPYCFEEMPLGDAAVERAAATAKVAVVVIGRAAGEDRENYLGKGSYYLTDGERAMLDKVTLYFPKTVVLMNCGSVMDMSWVNDYGDKIAGLMYVWQLGEESGNAVVNVLYGKVNPSGKLPDTIAVKYEDYPSAEHFGNAAFNEYTEDIYVGYRYFETFARDKVMYPFGYGLSYTEFDIEPTSFEYKNGIISASVTVRNTGKRSGKEVVQVYACPPQGKLGKPARNLVAYEKTPLIAAGEEVKLDFRIDNYTFASYDDGGLSGNKSAYVLESGKYDFYVGNSVRAEALLGTFTLDATEVLAQHKEVCIVERDKAFDVMYPLEKDGKLVPAYRKVFIGSRDLKKRIEENLPAEIPHSGERINFRDVMDGKRGMDEFIATLSDKELEAIARGEGKMNSAHGVLGNAGAYCGVLPSLLDRGVPAVITSDGPAGLRLRKQTALMPCGTAIAAAWNAPLTERLFEKEGEEMRHYKAEVLLAPGMNIHRNHLCGRNFEYFSEDPVLSGKTAAAAVRGVQSSGYSACPKHFAGNNQEVNRKNNDSRMSERALREIYLKGFEICVKESSPKNMMTSYNRINGVFSHFNYDLITTVLRGEWGYKGMVMTDWWPGRDESPEYKGVKDNAYRVRAGVNILMPGLIRGVASQSRSGLRRLNKSGGITRAELQQNAKKVLETAIILKKVD